MRLRAQRHVDGVIRQLDKGERELIQQSAPVLISPMGSPIGGTQDHTGTFEGDRGQDLPQFTEPWVPVGHPERRPVKVLAATVPLAAVQVQDMLLVAGE